MICRASYVFACVCHYLAHVFNVLGEKGLAELREELRALKENLTGGPGRNGQFSQIKDEIRQLKENLTKGLDGNCLHSEVQKQLCELREEVQRLKQNKSGVSMGGELFHFY